MKDKSRCTCEMVPGKFIPVEDVRDPVCPDCGKKILRAKTANLVRIEKSWEGDKAIDGGLLLLIRLLVIRIKEEDVIAIRDACEVYLETQSQESMKG